jgi:hypothetical protein
MGFAPPNVFTLTKQYLGCTRVKIDGSQARTDMPPPGIMGILPRDTPHTIN